MIILLQCILLFIIPKLYSFDHSHKKWSIFLSNYLDNNFMVNYSQIKKDISLGKNILSQYLIDLESVSDKEYNSWVKYEKMSYLVNAYNAFTIQLIVSNYPLNSITDIGGFFWFFNKRPWKMKFFNLLNGKIQTLNTLENDYLRKSNFQDYRIHAALNCASISCPRLRREAYEAINIDIQLDDQMMLWLNDNSKNSLEHENKVIFLSKIFSWYEDDFITNKSSVLDILEKYKIGQKEQLKNYQLKYMNYNWGLNDSKRDMKL